MATKANIPDQATPRRVLIVDDNGLLTNAGVRITNIPSVVVGSIPSINATVARTWTNLTFSAPTFLSVGTTAINVANSLAGRRGMVVANTHGSFNVFLTAGAAAVLNGGIYLAPNGTWVMDDLTFTTASISAIASGASLNLTVQEMT